MSQQNSGQMIQVPNKLGAKVGGGGRLGAIDPAAIAKAEAALKSLSGNFAQWLNDELAKLEAARQTVRSDGVTAETMESLYLRAHDLKGLGTTYGYPLVTRIGSSLCWLLHEAESRLSAPVALVEAHVDAISASVRRNIRSDADTTGRALAEELEAQTARIMRHAA